MASPQSDPKFSIIIVNYNGGAYLQAALDSLKDQTVRDFEVICVDNASTDGSVEGLDTSELPSFELIRSNENLGFAAGNNRAIKAARGQWMCLLNPDAVAEPRWLESITAGMERHPTCNVFACAQFMLEDPERLDGAGDAFLVFGIPWRGGFERPATELPGEGTCFSPCGASAIFRRDTFMEHGGYDERFFCYCEDVDLGYRMQLAGEDCIFLPDARIAHKGSGTSGADSYFTTYHGNRNRTWAFFKNTPLSLLILTLPGHVAILGYIYWRNRRNLQHTGMQDGIREGLRTGWQMRKSPEFKVRKRTRPLFGMMAAMAFNPFRMARRKAHVRPLRNR
ncbi:glycosyltransferase family 2 protein [Hyphomonas atlantica]|uniref:Glycosyltransferase 2-like domain-containing protein n=1 Tax=Hyphomonas atlantica TaxID=1280948 RepID=A0A059DWP8_9PROT|nr:glycosyltransferase family 2 protein [Hyphomonas atlantica]KCZ57806.1 hypothetical protein HY36_11555 [Hyphomonas atlantica]